MTHHLRSYHALLFPLLLAVVVVLSHVCRAESFKDFIRKDREDMKTFRETGKIETQPVVPGQELIGKIAKDVETKADWLIMVYIAGDNNLDSAAIIDIEEMETVGSSSRLKIAVLLDREEGQEWSSTRQFLVNKKTPSGKRSWDPRLDTCQDLGELNTGDPQTLSDFVTWATTNYPAEKTMLVFWNHGGGWRSAATKAGRSHAANRGPNTTVGGLGYGVLTRGIAWDDSNDFDFLESREIRLALEPFPRFSVIGCDACLMAMIEVAYEWRDQASYFVASEATEPNNGWPYDMILSALIDNPAMEPEELAGVVVQMYGEVYDSAEAEVAVTQSAVDLDKVTPVVEAIDVLSGELVSFIKSGGTIPESFRDVAGFPRGDRDFLDLDALLAGIATEEAFPTNLQAAAAASRTKLGECIVENHSHLLLEGKGLTIFPGGGYEAADYKPDIIQFAKDTQWDDFLQDLALQESVDTSE